MHGGCTMNTQSIILLLLAVLSVTKNCKTPNNKEGECVSLKLCTELTELLSKKQASATEYVKNSICEFNGTDALVCCPPYQKPVDYTVQQKLLPDRRYCGYQHVDDYFRNGTDIAINEFPWQAVLTYTYREDENNTSWKCAGVLISDRYILTAKHCITKTGNYKISGVRLGEYNVMNQTDCIEDSHVYECSDPPQDFGIENIITYPGNSEQANIYNHDIGLLRLDRKVQYSDYIRPICLSSTGGKSATTGDIVFLSGFGINTNTGLQTNLKKKISGEILSIENCTSYYRNKLPNVSAVLNEYKLCTRATDDTKDLSCSGDSGGPVMYSYRNQWHLEGITSFGTKICTLPYPEVHTKVSKYINWILENIKP